MAFESGEGAQFPVASHIKFAAPAAGLRLVSATIPLVVLAGVAGNAAEQLFPPTFQVRVIGGQVEVLPVVQLVPFQVSPAVLQKQPLGEAAPPAPPVEVPAKVHVVVVVVPQVLVAELQVCPEVSQKQPDGEAAPPSPPVEVPAKVHVTVAVAAPQVEVVLFHTSVAAAHLQVVGAAAPPKPVAEVPAGQRSTCAHTGWLCASNATKYPFAVNAQLLVMVEVEQIGVRVVLLMELM